MKVRAVAVAQAMVVVDVQRGWVKGAHAVHGADALLGRLSAGLTAARAAGALVVHLQDVGDGDSSVAPGTVGRELALAPLPDEPVIQKTVDDGFAETDLERLLRGARVESLVIGGLQSEMCVASTVRGALARQFTVVLPRDAHATHGIPSCDGVPEVPAAQVRRVAEWSLGDEVVVVSGIADVTFEPAAG